MKRLAWIVLAVAGCGSGKIGYLDSLDGRVGGGVIVLGELSTYDGLAEKLHTYVTRVELDRDGNVRAHDDLGEQRPSQRVPKPDGPRFGDGTRLEVLPFADDSVAPLEARVLDDGGGERWRVTLPIARLTDFVDEVDGALILGGPVAPTSDPAVSGVYVLELAVDGRLVWKTLL